MEHARELRERYQADPHRPRYHFLAPEGVCHPFDPQGCIYRRGRYHLFYAVQRPGSGVGLWGTPPAPTCCTGGTTRFRWPSGRTIRSSRCTPAAPLSPGKGGRR